MKLEKYITIIKWARKRRILNKKISYIMNCSRQFWISSPRSLHVLLLLALLFLLFFLLFSSHIRCGILLKRLAVCWKWQVKFIIFGTTDPCALGVAHLGVLNEHFELYPKRFRPQLNSWFRGGKFLEFVTIGIWY